MTVIRKKLIEVALPLEAINTASVREGYIYKGNPSSVHKWWAQRPLAACRAVLFGQLVDDPSAWPDEYPTPEAQDQERQRLFGLITDLVQWESSNKEPVINAARVEIARSLARGRKFEGTAEAQDEAVLRVPPSYGADGRYREQDRANVLVVNRYLAEVAPPVHDPFAGGGSIPLEAQRLGLRAIATDLNPVAVLINKALLEIPPRFAGMLPVNPESRRKAGMRSWKGAQGLAEDVRYYGKWMRDEAFKRLGHFYPHVELPKEYGAGTAMVIGWLWARTVASPNPAYGGVHVPLASTLWLSKKTGKEAWVHLEVDRNERAWSFEVRRGSPVDPDAVGAGTKMGRATFRCILSGDPITASYIQAQGRLGRIRHRLMAVVAAGRRERIYLTPSARDEELGCVPFPEGTPDFEFAKNSRHMTPWLYGLDTIAKLFTPRQLTILATLADLVAAVHPLMLADAACADPDSSMDGDAYLGYATGVAFFLALAVSKLADYHCSLVTWYPGEDRTSHLFTSNALPMAWDFVENNPFCDVGGSFTNNLSIVADGITALDITSQGDPGRVVHLDAASNWPTPWPSCVYSTDPPYYDNVPYADLSDIFFVWIRRALAFLRLDETRTLLVPKAEELVADPHRHEDDFAADLFFMRGMALALGSIRRQSVAGLPLTIYYAFKQSEKGKNSQELASTGWGSFLQAVCDCGLGVNGTWPIRTERGARKRGHGSNALASSIVLVCRKRPDDAPTIDRTTFRRLLRQELPAALRLLQKGNIAPVDMAQASIGPGMGIFSRHARVLEPDGSTMPVRTALQLINQALDEYLTEQEGEFDADTRFAVTWFETRQFEAGAYGEAETLAKARNVAVSGVAEAGIIHSAGGKVRLLRRDELSEGWDAAKDRRPTVWEATQHLIKRLDTKGETGAAELLATLGAMGAPARDLAYRLYTTCERKKWAEEARAYNGLVVAWPELEKLAAQVSISSGKAQMDLL